MLTNYLVNILTVAKTVDLIIVLILSGLISLAKLTTRLVIVIAVAETTSPIVLIVELF